MKYQYLHKIEDIRPEYNFLMGYHTGIPKKWYCGIEGVTYIFMGSWSDPLIGYKGYAINENLAIDGMWNYYKEEVPEPDYRDRKAYKAYEDGFGPWLKENKEAFFDDLDEIIAAYEEYEEEKTA